MSAHPNAHLNLIESSRRLFKLDPGAEIEVGEGWLFGAGRSTHPVISNAAFRLNDELDPAELVERARAWFGARARGFALWTRAGVAADRALIEVAERAGLRNVYAMPEMVLDGDAIDDDLSLAAEPADGVELRRVRTPREASQYWQVATAAYASIGFPPEIFAFYEDNEYLWAEGAAAFLAHLDGRPAGISMTIVTHGVAGIYWVGSTEEARGRGLGRTMTAAAVKAGLALGGGSASLQASPMGENLYRRMGFETIFDYRLYMCPAPEGAR